MMYKKIIRVVGVAAVTTVLGCSSGGNSAGNDDSGNNGGRRLPDVEQRAQGIINDCFSSHLDTHRFSSASAYMSNATLAGFTVGSEIRERGCAVSNEPDCAAKLKSIMLGAHTHCIGAGLSRIVEDGQHISFGVNFDLNGTRQTNIRSEVKAIESSPGGSIGIREIP